MFSSQRTHLNIAFRDFQGRCKSTNKIRTVSIVVQKSVVKNKPRKTSRCRRMRYTEWGDGVKTKSRNLSIPAFRGVYGTRTRDLLRDRQAF